MKNTKGITYSRDSNFHTQAIHQYNWSMGMAVWSPKW